MFGRREDYRYKILIIMKIVIVEQCDCVVSLHAIRPDVGLFTGTVNTHASPCPPPPQPSSVIRQSQGQCIVITG
jgi:hypothetical protein